MNFISSTFFWLFKICALYALSILHSGSLKYCFYFGNSWSLAANSNTSVGMMRLKEQKQSSQDYRTVWTTLWWLSKPVGKSQSCKYPTISCCLQLWWHLEFQNAVQACTFSFCPGISHPLALDTSPKWLDQEGLDKCCTWTRQPTDSLFTRAKLITFQCIQVTDDNLTDR